jgi:hypothetical protein
MNRKRRRDHASGQHPLIKYRDYEHWSSIRFAHNAYCDHCDKRIVGTRWKCINCPDFDLCDACEEILMKNQGQPHERTHSFLKIKYQGQLKQKHWRRILNRINGPHVRLHQGIRGFCPARHSPFFAPPAAAASPAAAPASTAPPAVQQEEQQVQQEEQQVQQEEQQVPQNEVVEAQMVNIEQPEVVNNEDVVDDEGEDEVNNVSEDAESKYNFAMEHHIVMDQGATISPNIPFLKVWQLKNSGNVAWVPGCYAQCVDENDPMCKQKEFIVKESVPVNSPVFVSVWMHSPVEPGIYLSIWRMCQPDGTPFGGLFFNEIEVKQNN